MCKAVRGGGVVVCPAVCVCEEKKRDRKSHTDTKRSWGIYYNLKVVVFIVNTAWV